MFTEVDNDSEKGSRVTLHFRKDLPNSTVLGNKMPLVTGVDRLERVEKYTLQIVVGRLFDTTEVACAVIERLVEKHGLDTVYDPPTICVIDRIAEALEDA